MKCRGLTVLVSEVVPQPESNGSPPKPWEIDALFYLNKTGCQWRFLPKTYPLWQTVYYHFRLWIESGVIERLNDALRRSTHVKAGRNVAGGWVLATRCMVAHMALRGYPERPTNRPTINRLATNDVRLRHHIVE
ncbi:MAG: transposase, partial [Bacteroidota bacterium]